jgi:Kef-type K+ transport system membrane component KefB
MSNSDLTSILLVLLLLVGLAHLFGYLFVRLHQPRVVGEIVAGIVLGPGSHVPTAVRIEVDGSSHAPRKRSELCLLVGLAATDVLVWC